MNTYTYISPDDHATAEKHVFAILPNMILECYETGGFEDESEIVDSIQAKLERLGYPVIDRIYIYDAIYHFEMP